MKIAWFKKDISPEIGCLIAGYGYSDFAVARLDDLYMTGLCCDDGEHKILLISFDLVGLDEWFIREIRKVCAEILETTESCVLLTCTHNHSGPLSASLSHPELLNNPYLEKLAQSVREEADSLSGKFQEADVYFYSSCVDENRNRRYTTADNCASFVSHRREVIPISEDFADKEFGSLLFFKPGTGLPLYGIGNYAAHPLAGHAPGLGGLRISADFPGAFRDYVTTETGAECMFISGAAGDMVPKEDELGSEAIRGMGIRLGKTMIGAMIDAPRNPGRFQMENPKVGGLIRTFIAPLRLKYRNNPKDTEMSQQVKSDISMEIQCVSVGDVAFVGLPDEPCAELGQEIKWHSPFRRTFIAYASTSLCSYICPANFLVSGGYEAMKHRFSARNTIDFVKCAVDGLFDLRESVYPSEDEPYPDNLELPLVNIPPNRKKK